MLSLAIAISLGCWIYFYKFFSKEDFWYRPCFQILISTKYNLYKSVLLLLLIDLMTAIYFRSGMILLDYFDIPSDEIRQYAAAYRPIEAVILLVNPISIAIFRKVRLLENVNRFHNIFYISEPNDFSMRQYCFFIRNFLSANTLVELSYGTEYFQASKLLSILAWMVYPSYQMPYLLKLL